MSMKPETRRFVWEIIAILLVLALVIGIAGYNHYQQKREEESEIPGEPLYRITYYLTEDGMVCSMIENLSDHDLTITFPDGIQPPAAEIGGIYGETY